MLFGLVQRRHHLRVLAVLRDRGPQRFNELKAVTRLESPQLSRALESLTGDLLVVARTVPAKRGRVIVEYRIAKQAERLLGFWDQFHAMVHGDSSPEARGIEAEMEALVS